MGALFTNIVEVCFVTHFLATRLSSTFLNGAKTGLERFNLRSDCINRSINVPSSKARNVLSSEQGKQPGCFLLSLHFPTWTSVTSCPWSETFGSVSTLQHLSGPFTTNFAGIEPEAPRIFCTMKLSEFTELLSVERSTGGEEPTKSTKSPTSISGLSSRVSLAEL